MSAVDYASEETVILSRFSGAWDSSSYPVAWDNVDFDPEADAALHASPADDAWVRLVVRPSGANQITIGPSGSRDFRHTGLIFVQIFVRESTGPGLASQLADTVASIFRSDSADGLVYDAPRKVVVGRDNRDWHQTNVEVPYRRDSTF